MTSMKTLPERRIWHVTATSFNGKRLCYISNSRSGREAIRCAKRSFLGYLAKSRWLAVAQENYGGKLYEIVNFNERQTIDGWELT